MIDKRLIDYSMEYADYKESLREEAKSFTLDDVMIVLEGGFLLSTLKRWLIQRAVLL